MHGDSKVHVQVVKHAEETRRMTLLSPWLFSGTLLFMVRGIRWDCKDSEDTGRDQYILGLS